MDEGRLRLLPEPNRPFLPRFAGRFAPSILIYLDDSFCVHPSILYLSPSLPPSVPSSHPFLLDRHIGDAPEIAQVTRFEGGKTTRPRQTDVRTDGRSDGRREREIWNDRRRSEVPDEIESEAGTGEERRASLTAINDGPPLSIYRTGRQSHSSIVRPPDGWANI